MALNNKTLIRRPRRSPVITLAEQDRGFSLLELLIALAIFSYAFLGLARLQLVLAQKHKTHAHQVDAAQIADDLLNKIDRNYIAIDDYVALSTQSAVPANDCQISSCNATDIAINDMHAIKRKLRSLPFSSLQIDQSANSTSIKLFWHPNPAVGANRVCPQQSQTDYHCFAMSRFMESAE